MPPDGSTAPYLENFAMERKPGRPRTRPIRLTTPVKRPRIKIGERQGSRIVLARDPSGTEKHPRYLVRCDCGVETVVCANTFRTADNCRKCFVNVGKRRYGDDRTIAGNPLYLIWTGMRYRCRHPNKKNAAWHGRGISVCQTWNDSFEAFEGWAIKNGYQPGLTIDRINPDGNYEPANCEWVTRSENSKRARRGHQSIKADWRSIHANTTPIEMFWGAF